MNRKHKNRIILSQEQTELFESVFTGNNIVELETSYGVKVGEFDYTEEKGRGMYVGQMVNVPKFNFAQHFKKLIRAGLL